MTKVQYICVCLEVVKFHKPLTLLSSFFLFTNWLYICSHTRTQQFLDISANQPYIDLGSHSLMIFILRCSYLGMGGC
jgi:hypothetical protein